MSFSDNLENDLKNMERSQEGLDQSRSPGRRQADRAKALATAPYAERLKNGPFTQDLLRAATRIGFGLRTKVNIFWMGGTLRLQAREYRLELRPSPDGVTAFFIVNGDDKKKEKVDLNGKGEALAKKWLDMVGPPPPPPPIPKELLEDIDGHEG